MPLEIKSSYLQERAPILIERDWLLYSILFIGNYCRSLFYSTIVLQVLITFSRPFVTLFFFLFSSQFVLIFSFFLRLFQRKRVRRKYIYIYIDPNRTGLHTVTSKVTRRSFFLLPTTIVR